MATGNISLTFDTPDIALTGTGEFDISDAFRALITSNEQIKDEISKKIAQIFRNIPAKEVADEWVTKIKKSFKLETMAIDLTKEVEKKSKELIKTMTFGQMDMAAVVPSMNRPVKKAMPSMDMDFKGFFKDLSENFDKFFIRMDKQSTKFFTTLTTTNNKFLKTISDNFQTSLNPSKDSTFDQSNEVIIGDFTDKALDKLSSLFENIGVAIKGKRRDSKDENDTDTEKPTKSLFENIMDKLLAGTGLGVAATMLKGLAGPALLAGGLLWAAIDGIRGWLKSDEWGVSKIAGALGGALGGMKEGLDGALANAGKGAMIGSGIGMMIGGPLGLIIGALIGTAVGGILGYIGGKNLAKGFDAFAKWFDEHIINGLFGGMEIIKEKLANVGSFFTEKVGPFLKDVFLNGLEYIEQTLLPAIKNLFEALVPVVKALWWVVENVVWPVVKWLGRGILEVAKKGVASFLDSLTFLINWFVAFGEQTGIVANWLYEKFLTFKDGFIKFGEAVGEGAAIIVDWLTEKIKLVWNFIKQPFIDITNLLKNLVDDPLKTIQDLWNNMITTFTSGFKVLFDWIANLGTILKDSIISLLPERLQNWIKEDKKSNSEKNLSPNNVVTNKGINNIKPVVQTKFNWVADSGNMIRFQSAKDDKEYKMARGTLNAKPDDMLGKTFQSIDKQLIALNTLTQKTMHKLDEHSEIFKSLLKVNQQQLGILPALAPQPMVQPKQFISNEKNDRIHEMRQQYRPNIWKDL